MYRLVAILLVSFAGTMPAAAFTIDFEEFSAGASSPLISGDYEIAASFNCDSQSPTCGAAVTAGNSFRVHSDPDFFDQSAVITIERSDGGIFAAHSMDILFQSGNGELLGTTAQGDNLYVYDDLSVLGQGDWLNLVSFSYSVSIPGGTPVPAIIDIDNIVVTAVPIPAAAWLFGSALAGLGWFRRRQSV